MDILVTVGTGSFDALVEKCVSYFQNLDEHNIIYQVGNSTQSFGQNELDILPNFDKILASSDLVITHAGAGTIFKLLERKKRFLVVPNLTRSDSHQLDIASWLQSNKLCEVCDNLDFFESSLDNIFNDKVIFHEYYNPKFEINRFMKEVIYS